MDVADLVPFDLLSRALPGHGQALPGVHMVQHKGARGFQLSGPNGDVSFPASQLFVNCDFFPEEFSIVVTLKVSHLTSKVRQGEASSSGFDQFKCNKQDETITPHFRWYCTFSVAIRPCFQKNEYIFTLVEDNSAQLLLGLRFSQEKLHLLFLGPRGKEYVTLRAVKLMDNRWHTLVLTVTGHHFTLSLDCGMPLEM